MGDLSRENYDINISNENIFNCKDTKLQLFTIYQIMYWGILLIFKILSLEIEPDLKNRIIFILSCISLISILLVTFHVIAKSKYKWSGVLIILFSSTLTILYQYIS